MKRIIILLISLMLVCIPSVVNAFDTSARCGILMDMDSGYMFYAKNIHEVRSVASISKIMTALLAVESSKLDRTVTVGSEISTAYGSGIYIKEGEQLTLADLVYGLMLRSGNDAALAIAHYVGGTVEDFVVKMNDKATEIGMKNTAFHNPHGLDEENGNMSTAYDMALLMAYAMKNEAFVKITGTIKYSLTTNMNTYSWTNKNKLLNQYEYATGGKTGFTQIAKRTLVTTASKDGMNLVAVTLNDGNDFSDHKGLFEEAFLSYTNHQILEAGPITVYEEEYYKNKELYLKKNFSYPILNSQEKNILLKISLSKERFYQDDDIVGIIGVYIDEKCVFETDIYVRGKQVKTSMWQKLKDWLGIS